ncbi:331_t:CDS:2, partial [Acaulospora morrowiae]
RDDTVMQLNILNLIYRMTPFRSIAERSKEIDQYKCPLFPQRSHCITDPVILSERNAFAG